MYVTCLIDLSIFRQVLRPALGPKFAQFQFANPASATARNGFKPGMYGRLDAKDWFHTTVTNVDPTAKQSYVLHPKVRRLGRQDVERRVSPNSMLSLPVSTHLHHPGASTLSRLPRLVRLLCTRRAREDRTCDFRFTIRMWFSWY